MQVEWVWDNLGKFLKRVRQWFRLPVRYQVVEVEKPVPRLSDSDAVNIVSLENHPGIEALLARWRTRRALLETTLKKTRHKDLFEVYNLQNGIEWASWLERDIEFYTNRKVMETRRDAFELEENEFRRIAEALRIVGRDETV